VNDHYFRAVAKIAFHYYLTHSLRAQGDEAGFDGLRNFILRGGDIAPFFEGPRRFVHLRPNWVPTRWCHILAAVEEPRGVVAYVCLFRGPSWTGREYTVWLGDLGSRILVPETSWAHAYYYEPGKAGETKVGAVQRTSLRRVHR